MSFIKSLRDKFLPLNRRIFKRHMVGIDSQFDVLFKKLSMWESIWQVEDTRFFVPNYPVDYIQRIIVDQGAFFEQNLLEELGEYIPENAVICDIGANIGNHTLYWFAHHDIKFVYCFEPRAETFHILQKNIKINGYEDRTKCFNLALSDKKAMLKTIRFNHNNIGGNMYGDGAYGKTQSIPLDDLEIAQKVDFMKIDVEGMEEAVLKGALKIIKRDHPILFIEIFSDKYTTVASLLAEQGYSLAKTFPEDNYLFFSVNSPSKK